MRVFHFLCVKEYVSFPVNLVSSIEAMCQSLVDVLCGFMRVKEPSVLTHLRASLAFNSSCFIF